MTTKKRGLGRGLDSLLGTAESPAVTSKADTTQIVLPIENLQRGEFQPRQSMDEEALEELSRSITQQGIIQPIVVRLLSKDKYEIIAGERRWRAAQLAKLDEVPVVVRKVSDRQVIAMSLIENIQRENLNPIEEAQSLKRLIDEFTMTQEQAATAVGRSRSAVANILRLLGLPATIKEMLKQGEIEMGHARALLGAPDNKQIQAAQHIKNNGLSVRAAEKYIKSLSVPSKNKEQPRAKDPDVVLLENQLQDTLNAKVQLKQGTKGKGTISIYYSSLDELEGILAHIK